jgi:hypothetical protein
VIVVTVELWPYGIEGLKRHLGTARIWNDTTGDPKTGNYQIELLGRMESSDYRGYPGMHANPDWGSDEVSEEDLMVTLSKWGRPDQVWKKGEVKGFPRTRLGAWDLLYLALRNIVGSRNREVGS